MSVWHGFALMSVFICLCVQVYARRMDAEHANAEPETDAAASDWDDELDLSGIDPADWEAAKGRTDKQTKRLEALFCIKYSTRGFSYTQISAKATKEFNYRISPRDVSKRIAEEVERQSKLRGTDLAMVRERELVKLDTLEQEIWQVLRATHYVVREGSLVVHPTTGEFLTDDAPVLNAVDRLLKVMERRSKFQGLDAPVKLDAQVSHTGLDPRVERIIADAKRRVLERATAAIEAPAVSHPAGNGTGDLSAVDAEIVEEDDSGEEDFTVEPSDEPETPRLRVIPKDWTEALS